MSEPLRVAVLTISDGCAAGVREDESGEHLSKWTKASGYDLAAREIVPDEVDQVAALLVRWADRGIADLVLTTGGTGFTARDVTPEATRAVLEREAPGIAEALRADALPKLPSAMLARGVAGIRGRTLIVNLPGSVSGVRDGVRVLAPVLDHAVALLRGEDTAH